MKLCFVIQNHGLFDTSNGQKSAIFCSILGGLTPHPILQTQLACNPIRVRLSKVFLAITILLKAQATNRR